MVIERTVKVVCKPVSQSKPSQSKPFLGAEVGKPTGDRHYPEPVLDDETHCLIWRGPLSATLGWAQMDTGGRRTKRKRWTVVRKLWQHYHGVVLTDPRHVLVMMCGNKACVNIHHARMSRPFGNARRHGGELGIHRGIKSYIVAQTRERPGWGMSWDVRLGLKTLQCSREAVAECCKVWNTRPILVLCAYAELVRTGKTLQKYPEGNVEPT